MKNLMSMLKIITSNIEVLHRNVYGTDFFSTHDVTREYYKFLSDMTDDVIEIFMSLGQTEPTLEEAIRVYEPIKPEPIKTSAVFFNIREMFNDLMDQIDLVKETIPHDVADKLQEYKRWLRKEADYKLARATNSIN